MNANNRSEEELGTTRKLDTHTLFRACRTLLTVNFHRGPCFFNRSPSHSHRGTRRPVPLIETRACKLKDSLPSTFSTVSVEVARLSAKSGRQSGFPRTPDDANRSAGAIGVGAKVPIGQRVEMAGKHPLRALTGGKGGKLCQRLLTNLQLPLRRPPRCAGGGLRARGGVPSSYLSSISAGSLCIISPFANMAETGSSLFLLAASGRVANDGNSTGKGVPVAYGRDVMPPLGRRSEMRCGRV